MRPPRLPRGLLGRLALVFLVIAAATVAATAAALHHHLQKAVRSAQEGVVAAAAKEAAARLAAAGPSAHDAAAALRFDPEADAWHFALLDDAGRVIAISHGARPALPVLGTDGQPPPRFFRAGDGGRLWGATLPVDFAGRRAWLQVAEDMEAADAALDDVPGDALWPMVGIVAASSAALLAANLLSVRLLLAPLRRATEQAQRIALDGGSGLRRLDGASASPETAPLVHAVNAALDRRDMALERHRAFSQDVAHELRTPLTILRARVDLMRDRAEAEELRAELASLARLVNQLLEEAEADAALTVDGTAADLASVAAEVAARLAPEALRRGRSVALLGDPGPLWVRGDPDAIGRAVRNLLENALVHTPEGTTVALVLRSPATLEVADRGPGVPDGQKGRVFDRFWRADRTRDGGAGLGLSIVSRTAAQCGGAVEVADRPGGGAVFRLMLRPSVGGGETAAAALVHNGA